jgi:hypothetical protein
MTKLAVSFCVLVIIAYISWRWVVRHTEVRTVDAHQVTGGPVRVRVLTSRRLYLGSGHWGYGGGDTRVVLEFSLGDRTVRWEGKAYEEPRVLQVRGQEAYVVSQVNRWSLIEQAHLNFYSLASTLHGVSWIPIELNRFPASLANCNLSPEGRAWRVASAEERKRLIEDTDEQYVQDLLDRLFHSSDAQVK